MIRLIPEHRAQPIERDGQPEILQRRQRAQRSHRFHIGRVFVHGAASAERRGQRDEIIAMAAGRSRMQGLLVRSRARGCAAVEILRGDNDINSVPLQLDGGAPARGPAAEHEGVAGVNRQP